MCGTCKQIISSMSIAQNWEEAMDEWTPTQLYNQDITHKCMCGCDSYYAVQLTNKYNDNELTIGRICVVGNGDTPSCFSNKLIKAVKYIDCEECKIKILYNYKAKHEETRKHKLNCIENRTKRCIMCKAVCENTEYDKCLDCMQRDYERTNYWMCTECHEHNIPKATNSKYRLCSGCYNYCIKKDSNCPKCSQKTSEKQLERFNKCVSCVRLL